MTKIVEIQGQTVDLGELDEDEVVLDAMVVLRVTRLGEPRGSSAVITVASDHTDYVTQVGMLNVAGQIINDESWDS